MGADQHGHMETVGYDLFMKLLNEAVLEEKGELKSPLPECLVDLNINAYIPEYYISSSNQRIDAYKKTALIECIEDMRDVYDELTDRFGKLPDVTENLLYVSLLRVLGGKAGFVRIERKGKEVFFHPQRFVFADMSKFVSFGEGRCAVKMGKDAFVAYKCPLGPKGIRDCCDILNKYVTSLKN